MLTPDTLLADAQNAHARKDLDKALTIYRQILKDEPDNPTALCNIVAVHCDRGAPIDGESVMRSALRRMPDFAEGYTNLGFCLQRQGRLIEAIEAYRTSIALKPGQHLALNNLAASLQDSGHLDEAIRTYRAAIALKGDYTDAWSNLSGALVLAGRYQEGADAARSVLALAGEHASIFNTLGMALHGLGQLNAAQDAFAKATELDPKHADAWNNWGILLKDQGKLDEAMAQYRRVLVIAPQYVKAHANMGVALKESGRLAEAVASLRHAIELSPAMPDAHMNLALTHLLAGEYPDGFREYEWRWAANHVTPRHQAIPRWTGQDLAGKSLLIHAEQGLGDTLQFARFIPILERMGLNVVFEVPPQLKTILATMSVKARIVSKGDSLDNIGAQLPLLSLPGLLGITIPTIPSGIPYLTAAPERIEHWRPQIKGSGLTIGIAWQGNPLGKVDQGRSMPLATLAPLWDIPGIRIVSLQKHHGLEQLAELPKSRPIITLGDTFDEGPDGFTDTAAVMACLDAVVSTDTAISHLAGALGRPTYVLLRKVPDWRWGMSGTTTPWYPTARLIRQDRHDDWESAVAKLVKELTR